MRCFAGFDDLTETVKALCGYVPCVLFACCRVVHPVQCGSLPFYLTTCRNTRVTVVSIQRYNITFFNRYDSRRVVVYAKRFLDYSKISLIQMELGKTIVRITYDFIRTIILQFIFKTNVYLFEYKSLGMQYEECNY